MEEAAFAYLMHGTVYGSLSLTPVHMRELINKYVGLAKQHLRSVSLPTIDDQMAFIVKDRLPADFRRQKALQVYSVGTDPWMDVETVEYWFVDRDGRWYWIRCDSQGGRADYSTVTAQHLVNRRTNDDRVPVEVLSQICEAFRRKFIDAAERARALSDDLTKAAAALTRDGSLSGFIPPSAP